MNIEKQIKSALLDKNSKKFVKIGEAFQFGEKIEQSRKDAIKWYKKATSLGDVDGLVHLARLYSGEWNSKRSQSLAHKYYLEAANLGNSEAQVAVAYAYYYGDWTDISISDAIYWFEKAAKSQDISSWVQLVRIYLDKSNKQYNTERGNYWIRRILKEENPDYISQLGYEYLYGDTLPISSKRAVKYFKLASDLGSIDAKLRLAVCYSSGDGVKKNKLIASQYLEQIYKSNDIEWIQTVAYELDYEGDLAESGEKAFKWFKKAANLGDSYSQMKVGRCYRDGDGCRISYKLAEKWLLKSADQENGSASFSLGYLYQKNWKGKDYKKSMYYFKKALRLNVVNSYSAIGWMYQLGYGVKKSSAIALQWFNKGLKNDDIRSHYAIGWMSFNGCGCKKDYESAFVHYKKSVEGGYYYACIGLGYLYQNGLGCRKNIKKAVEIYQKGISDNIADCFFNLGILYDNGLCFDTDHLRAVELYEKAASLGSASAKYYLGVRYLYGRDVKKNTRRANQYFKESILDDSVYMFEGHYHRFAELHLDDSNKLNKKKSIYWFTKAANQGWAQSYMSLGKLFLEGDVIKKNTKKAISFYKKAATKGYYEAYGYLGYRYWEGKYVKKDHKRAKDLFLKAYEKNALYHKNSFAWLLSTSPNKNLLDSKLAIQLSKDVIKQFGYKSFRVDTLAAAYALDGDFSEAIKLQKRAISLLKKEGKVEQLEEFETRLESYKTNKRWIE